MNVNTEARDKNRFRRLRDELWWEVREEFESGIISIPDDPALIEELSAFHYKEEDGIIKVESKEELKARGFDSPNKGDCIMMRRYYTPLDVQRMKPSKIDRRSRRELEDRVKQESIEMIAARSHATERERALSDAESVVTRYRLRSSIQNAESVFSISQYSTSAVPQLNGSDFESGSPTTLC